MGAWAVSGREAEAEGEPEEQGGPGVARSSSWDFSFYNTGEKCASGWQPSRCNAFDAKLRQLTRRTRSGKLEEVIQEVNQYTMGWIGYFRLADTERL
jgi:hypothetical protein